MNVTTILASDWYQNLMQLIPDGKLFSLRSVFDGIPRIVQQLPTTIMLTIGGALFGLVLALLFCHCENQSCQNFISLAGLLC